MQRGFKAEAEKRVAALRAELQLHSRSPLYARTLANYMGIPILVPSDIRGMSLEHLNELLGRGSSNWSALTLITASRTFIIHNPSHSFARQETNLMHELAHLICKHQPSEILRIDGFSFPMRTCDSKQEEEADWVCGCLKLPRDGLLWAVRSQMTDDNIASHFGASLELIRYRIRITGVQRQVERERQKRQGGFE